MSLRSRNSLVFAVAALISAAAMAKIGPQKPVAPVESNGVRYSAEDREYVSATDIATGTQLWKVRVFHTHIKPWVEPDVQLVFIKQLKLVNSTLLVRDGKARCYGVNVGSHRVRKTACVAAFPEDQSAR